MSSTLSRAYVAIDALERFIANPDASRTKGYTQEPPLCPELIEAARLERDRISAAIGHPARLKRIFPKERDK